MFKHIIGLCLVCLIIALARQRPPQAQWAVIDVAAIAQLIQEVQTMRATIADRTGAAAAGEAGAAVDDRRSRAWSCC